MKNFVRLVAILFLALGLAGCETFVTASSPSLKNAGIPKDFSGGGTAINLQYSMSKVAGESPDQRKAQLAALLQQHGFEVTEDAGKADYTILAREANGPLRWTAVEAITMPFTVLSFFVLPMFFHTDKSYVWEISQNGQAVSTVTNGLEFWEMTGPFAALAMPGENRRYNRDIVAAHEAILAELIDQGLFE